MVCVDVDERGVVADGAFEKCDEGADGASVDASDGNRHRFAGGFGECLSGAEEEAVEVVAGCDAVVDFDGWCAVFEDVDECHKKVIDAVAQLLDVGVLVGGAFVAVDGEALVDAISVEVEGFSERFHDELLEVSREEEEFVFVGEHDEVAAAFAVGGVEPHGGHEHGGIFGDVACVGVGVAEGSAVAECVDVDAL